MIIKPVTWLFNCFWVPGDLRAAAALILRIGTFLSRRPRSTPANSVRFVMNARERTNLIIAKLPKGLRKKVFLVTLEIRDTVEIADAVGIWWRAAWRTVTK